jgi:hypothetical protein
VRGDFALAGEMEVAMDCDWQLQLLWTKPFEPSAVVTMLKRVARVQRQDAVDFHHSKLFVWHQEHGRRGPQLRVRAPATAARHPSTLTVDVEAWPSLKASVGDVRLMPTIAGVVGARIHCLGISSAIAEYAQELVLADANPCWARACWRLHRLLQACPDLNAKEAAPALAEAFAAWRTPIPERGLPVLTEEFARARSNRSLWSALQSRAGGRSRASFDEVLSAVRPFVEALLAHARRG